MRPNTARTHIDRSLAPRGGVARRRRRRWLRGCGCAACQALRVEREVLGALLSGALGLADLEAFDARGFRFLAHRDVYLLLETALEHRATGVPLPGAPGIDLGFAVRLVAGFGGAARCSRDPVTGHGSRMAARA